MDSRAEIERTLDAHLTPELLERLFTNVLAIEKTGRGFCPSCRKVVMVPVPDAKAVVGALNDLLIQAKGRPAAAEASGGERELVFTNRVVVVGEEG